MLIIDAIKVGATDKTFVCIDGRQLDSVSTQLSSHETGVIESVALLESLNLVPKQLVIVGVSNTENEIIEKITNML